MKYSASANRETEKYIRQLEERLDKQPLCTIGYSVYDAALILLKAIAAMFENQ